MVSKKFLFLILESGQIFHDQIGPYLDPLLSPQDTLMDIMLRIIFESKI